MIEFSELRNAVKARSPLIHSITNPISINQCANAVLAIGGRPIMAEHPKEVSEITASANALLLNLGNITDVRMKSMRLSFKQASKNNIPVILDVVGIACSSLRRKFVSRLLKISTPTVIKGNYSEIQALYNRQYRCLGVDADLSLKESDIEVLCIALAKKLNTIVLASGKTDIVTNGKRIVYIHNGSKQLTTVTGTGCMLGALCATYLSSGHYMDAVVTACVTLCISGEISATESGSGSFMANLMNSLSTLSNEVIVNSINMEEKSLE